MHFNLLAFMNHEDDYVSLSMLLEFIVYYIILFQLIRHIHC
jgi:hypothetical protein